MPPTSNRPIPKRKAAVALPFGRGRKEMPNWEKQKWNVIDFHWEVMAYKQLYVLDRREEITS